MPQHRLPVGSWGKVTVSRRGQAWQARVYVRDADGVRRQVRAQAPTKAAARQALARALSGRARPPTGLMGPSTTVDQLLDAWLEHVRALGRVRPQTVDGYARVAGSIVSPALGAWLIGEVTAAAVQDAPKTDRSRRTLFLPDFVVVTLVEHGPRETGPVLVTRTGACTSPANLRRSLRAAVAEAGLDFAVTPHTQVHPGDGPGPRDRYPAGRRPAGARGSRGHPVALHRAGAPWARRPGRDQQLHPGSPGWERAGMKVTTK